MPTSPPSITALPSAPDPSNRTTFNALAYPWSAALPTFGTEVSAVGANVKANADEAQADAVATAADRVQTGLDAVAAAASAEAADSSADAAAASAVAADASADAAAASAAVAASAAAFLDTNPVVKGSADATKQVRFEVDGLTTATTRVLTVPDADLTLVGTGTAQTLTNKTLTGYTETVYALAGTVIDPANGTVQIKTLSGNTTFTESLADGQSVMLGITAGAYSVTWPTTTWSKVGGSGVAPTLTSTGVNWVILWQAGATLYGAFLGTT